MLEVCPTVSAPSPHATAASPATAAWPAASLAPKVKTADAAAAASVRIAYSTHDAMMPLMIPARRPSASR